MQEKKMNVFSFSRLSLFDTCPYRFYRKYVEGYVEPITYPLALGKAVHKAIEEKMSGANHDYALLSGFVEAEFHEDVTRGELSGLVWKAPIQGKNAIRGETEIYFKIPLSDELDAPLLQGFIDVVGDGYIVDWKTNRIPYDVRYNYQVALYSWAISKLRGYKEVYGSCYFLRFRRESSFLFTDTEMEEARKWAYNLSKEIQGKLDLAEAVPELKDDLFPAKASSFCSHCPFSVDCVRKFSVYKSS